MRSSFAPLALAAFAAAKPMPQGVTSSVSPSSSVPESCSTDYPGTFKIQIVNATTASKAKRQSQNEDDTLLQLTLSGGTLKDEKDRTGYVASNSQLQFDSPPQAGAIYTAGFAVCQNGSLTIGNDATWYACLSGTFYNLYDQNDAAQCSPVYIQAIAGSAAPVASQSADGQVTATVASQQPDGQVTGSVVSQISDGQIQATTAAVAPVTQISDGQIQATTATPAAPVTQISDGQIQATSAIVAPVTQISDGQIQATSAIVAPVTQISDGQIQATTAVPTSVAVSPITQISDGQIQAPTNGTGYTGPAATSVVAYTGAAAMPTAMAGSVFGVVGLLAAAMI